MSWRAFTHDGKTLLDGKGTWIDLPNGLVGVEFLNGVCKIEHAEAYFFMTNAAALLLGQPKIIGYNFGYVLDGIVHEFTTNGGSLMQREYPIAQFPYSRDILKTKEI